MGSQWYCDEEDQEEQCEESLLRQRGATVLTRILVKITSRRDEKNNVSR